MINIDISMYERSDVQTERMKIALAESDFHTFRSLALACAVITIGPVVHTKHDAYVVDIATELLSWLLSLGRFSSSGYISFGNESFFYFDHISREVSFYLYDPRNIADENYKNLLGTANKEDLIEAIINALLQIRLSMKDLVTHIVPPVRLTSQVALEVLLGFPTFNASDSLEV